MTSRTPAPTLCAPYAPPLTFCTHCGRRARQVIAWQSPIMRAPAFWYGCKKHTRESLQVLRRNRRALTVRDL